MIPRLHVEVDGERHRSEATPLVLVNGAWCTTRQWDGIVGRFADTRMVIRHDVRGTGRSAPGPPDQNTFETYAADIVGLCADLDVDCFDLWGMAWGARVALVTAAMRPASIRRLALFDLAIDPADPEAQKSGAAEAKRARAEAGLPEQPKPMMEQLDPESTASALGATRLHPDLWPMVGRVGAPTLLATGEFDPNLESTRRALTGFSNATLEVLPLTGHGSVLQRPDVCADVASAFLDI